MSNDLHHVMVQIVGEMGKMMELSGRLPEVNSDFFQIFVGLTVALTKIWETETGATPGSAIERQMKPQELLAWAKDQIIMRQSKHMFEDRRPN